MHGYLALEENNQKQSNRSCKLYQANISQENKIEFMKLQTK